MYSLGEDSLTSVQAGTCSTASSTSGCSLTMSHSGLTVWPTVPSLESPTAGTLSSSTGWLHSDLSFSIYTMLHFRFCPLFPYQSIKTVRLRLNLTKPLVEELNVRILLLVRDPRGTVESRKHRVWCPGNRDCEDPARLCQDLQSDHEAFLRLSALYPGRYK